MERDKIKTDLAPLFLPRQSAMSEEEANQMMEECNEDLELLEPFVLVSYKIMLYIFDSMFFYTGLWKLFKNWYEQNKDLL